MDITRTVESTVEFTRYRYEHILAIDHSAGDPANTTDLLKDVEIQFHGHSAFSPDVEIGKSLHDLRIYLNSVDVTRSVREVLLKQFAAMAPDDLRGAYDEALETWLILVSKFGAASPSPLAVEEAKREAIITSLLGDPIPAVALSNLLQMLGDTGAVAAGGGSLDWKWGWGGNQHIINFLYRQIPLKPISLSEVLEHHNAGGGALPLSDVLSLTFSSGVARLVDPGWDPSPPPTGCLSYLLSFRYTNPLDADVADLKDKLTRLIADFQSLQTFIRSRLKSIFDNVKSDGPIQGTLGSIETALGDAATNLRDVDTTVHAHEVLLAAVQADVDELTSKIEALP